MGARRRKTAITAPMAMARAPSSSDPNAGTYTRSGPTFTTSTTPKTAWSVNQAARLTMAPTTAAEMALSVPAMRGSWRRYSE